MSKLRRVLGDGVLVTRAGGYVLQVRAADVDSGRFEALVADGRGASRRMNPDAAAELLLAALGLWRGPAFARTSRMSRSRIARSTQADERSWRVS